MKFYTKRKDRVEILKVLTKEQRRTLFKVIGKGYRSYFSNILAKYKGTEEWAFYGYIDHGRVRKEIKCECGRPLRHQYILINKKTKQKRNIGSTHLIEELQIPKDIAKEVAKGIHNINHDLDELLYKFNNGWELPLYIKKYINEIGISKDIEQLLRMELPLLGRHVDLLYTRIEKLISNGKEKSYIVNINANEKGVFQYEVKNEDIYKILIGKMNFSNYFDRYLDDIHTYLRAQKKYVPIYDIVDYLVSNSGLANELMYGQHALTKFIINYLDQRGELKGNRRDDGYMYYCILR